jgi:glucosamine--fructose-6-phosphate aminotransferase (isomerizing)
MCGIVGYIGSRNTQEILLNGLSKLEYRGYDSAGVAVYTNKGLAIKKATGRLMNLANQLEISPLAGNAGIGHTRWATHGKPSDLNSHPHHDVSLKFSVVHNGIIENYMALKEELIALGRQFVSETDTEVIAHLIAELYEGDIVNAVQKATQRMKGAFALAVLSEYEPDRLIAVRFASPLIIGVGNGENFIGSDIPAILDYTRDVYILNDGEMAVITKDHVEMMSLTGEKVSRQTSYIDWDIVTAEKAGFDHFMIKEINEQPKAYLDTMRGRISTDEETILMPEVKLSDDEIRQIERIHIVACGTAFHAGLIGKQVIEGLVRIPVETDVASEYRYRNPIISPQTLVIVVSQSGETADTLAALREAKRCGAKVVAITNVVGSSIAREADHIIMTWAGPEIAVASTKAYTSQLISFYLFGLFLAQIKQSITSTMRRTMIAHLQKLPEQVDQILNLSETFKKIAQDISQHDNLFFVGRGLDYAVALEGSLKLKEISYIHSEAYQAGELKHGTLALIEEGTPIIALGTQLSLMDKMISNIKEIKTRGGQIWGIGVEGQREFTECVDHIVHIPKTLEILMPALSVIPLQIISYYAAVARGNDVDKPRNLAKSVTVE